MLKLDSLRIVTLVCGIAAGAAIAQAPPSTPPAPAADVPAADPATNPPSAPASTPAPTPPASPSPSPAPANAPASAANAADPLSQFAWLEGCWSGSVNKRDFREHWLPPRGSLMIGASHTVMAGRTSDFEYLRIEPRADGIYYINAAMGPAPKETLYRLVDRAMDQEDEVFTFSRGGQEFPEKILYRHNAGGWLYATVAGKINGEEKQVIYPMRRVNCETGQFIRK